MHNHVRGLFQQSPGVTGNLHSPGRVGRADHIAQILADFCRVVINGANNFDGFFFPHQFQD